MATSQEFQDGLVPQTMRAWTYSSPGVPSTVLSLNESLPTPTLSGPTCTPTSVLVKISYAALNPGGTIAIKLFPKIMHSAPAPWVPELDFSGTIVAIGSGVAAKRDDLRPGDEVFGIVSADLHLKAGAGALGEYAITDADFIVRKPTNASHESVAGLGVAGTTAMLMMRKADLQPGERVLVVGGSGGIGSLIVQLTRRAVGQSGYIAAVCSPENFGLVKSLGANECIDRKAMDGNVVKQLATTYSSQPFDVVLDSVGLSSIYLGCGKFLKAGKTWITVGVKTTEYTRSALLWSVMGMLRNIMLPGFLGGGPRSYHQVNAMVPQTRDLQYMSDAIQAGELRGVVDKVWEMEEAAPQAYDRFLNGNHLRGKVVVKVGK